MIGLLFTLICIIVVCCSFSTGWGTSNLQGHPTPLIFSSPAALFALGAPQGFVVRASAALHRAQGPWRTHHDRWFATKHFEPNTHQNTKYGLHRLAKNNSDGPSFNPNACENRFKAEPKCMVHDQQMVDVLRPCHPNVSYRTQNLSCALAKSSAQT